MKPRTKAEYDAWVASKSAPQQAEPTQPASPVSREDQLISQMVAEKANDPGVKDVLATMPKVPDFAPVEAPQPEPMLVSPAWTKDFGQGTTAAKDYLTEKTAQGKARSAEVGPTQATAEVQSLSDQGLLPPVAAIKPVTQGIERAEIETVGLDNLLSQAIQAGDQTRINDLQRIAGEMYRERDAGAAQPDSGVTVGGVVQGAGRMLADTAQGGFELLQGVGTDIGYGIRGATRQLNPAELEAQARNKSELGRAIPYAGGSAIAGGKSILRGVTDIAMNASGIPEWQQDVGLAYDRAKDLAKQDMVAQGTGELGDKTLRKMQALDPTIAGADEEKVRRMGDTTALGVTLIAPNAAFGLVNKGAGAVSKGAGAVAKSAVGAAEKVVPGTAKAVESVGKAVDKLPIVGKGTAVAKLTKQADEIDAQVVAKLAEADSAIPSVSKALKKEANDLIAESADLRSMAEKVNPSVSATRQSIGRRLAQVGSAAGNSPADQVASNAGNRVMSRIGRGLIGSAKGGAAGGVLDYQTPGAGLGGTISGAILGGLGGMIGRGGMTAIRRKTQQAGLNILSGASKQGTLSKIIERGAKGSVPGAAAAYGMTASDWDRMTPEERNAVIGGGMAIGGIVNQVGQKKAPATDAATPPKQGGAPEPVAPKPAPSGPEFKLEQETTQGPPAPRVEQGELPLDATPAPVAAKPTVPEWNLPRDARGELIVQKNQVDFAVELSRDIPRLQERIASIPADATPSQLARKKFWEASLAEKQKQLADATGPAIQLPGEAGPKAAPAAAEAAAPAPAAKVEAPAPVAAPKSTPLPKEVVTGLKAIRKNTPEDIALAQQIFDRNPSASVGEVINALVAESRGKTQTPKALNPATPEPTAPATPTRGLNPASKFTYSDDPFFAAADDVVEKFGSKTPEQKTQTPAEKFGEQTRVEDRPDTKAAEEKAKMDADDKKAYIETITKETVDAIHAADPSRGKVAIRKAVNTALKGYEKSGVTPTGQELTAKVQPAVTGDANWAAGKLQQIRAEHPEWAKYSDYQVRQLDAGKPLTKTTDTNAPDYVESDPFLAMDEETTVAPIAKPKELTPSKPEAPAPSAPAKLDPRVEAPKKKTPVVVEKTPEEKARLSERAKKRAAYFSEKASAAEARSAEINKMIDDSAAEKKASAEKAAAESRAKRAAEEEKANEVSRKIRDKAEKSGITQTMAQKLLDADKTPKGKLEDPFDRDIQPLRNQVYKAMGGEPLGNKQPSGQQVAKLLTEKFGSIEEARAALRTISNKKLDPKSGFGRLADETGSIGSKKSKLEIVLEKGYSPGQTSISRNKPSTIFKLVKDGAYIKKGDKVLHAGAGEKSNPDRAALAELGETTNYDPQHADESDPKLLRNKDKDVVVSPFVLNVLDARDRRVPIADMVLSLKKDGKAIVGVRGDKDVSASKATKSKWDKWSDGYLTPKGGGVTFQKGFTAQELVDTLKPYFKKVTIIRKDGQAPVVLAEGPLYDTVDAKATIDLGIGRKSNTAKKLDPSKS